MRLVLLQNAHAVSKAKHNGRVKMDNNMWLIDATTTQVSVYLSLFPIKKRTKSAVLTYETSKKPWFATICFRVSTECFSKIVLRKDYKTINES